MNFKNIVTFCAVAMLFAACNSKKEDELNFIISNPCNFERAEVVEIKFPENKNNITNGDFIFTNADGKQLPYQKIDGGALVFVNTLALSKAKITLKAGKPEKFVARAYGKQAPERMNDYLWENDKVAFRIYEKTLIATDGPSNGIDYWAKATPNLIIEKWLKGELKDGVSYHDDHGEGCDCYKVGRTLGCGALAPYVDDTLVLGQNYVKFEMLENGPLRVSARVTYDTLNVAGSKVVESRLISLDAGSNLSRIDVTFKGAPAMDIAAGIILKNDKAAPCNTKDMNPKYTPVLEPEKGFIAYEEVADKRLPEQDNGTIFTAVLFPHALKKAAVEKMHVLAVTPLAQGADVVYYQGAATSKTGMTETHWLNYLVRFSEGLRNPLTVDLVEN